eukprot:886310-Pleurochrysis_carterae.AAC.1
MKRKWSTSEGACARSRVCVRLRLCGCACAAAPVRLRLCACARALTSARARACLTRTESVPDDVKAYLLSSIRRFVEEQS